MIHFPPPGPLKHELVIKLMTRYQQKNEHVIILCFYYLVRCISEYFHVNQLVRVGGIQNNACMA